MHIPESAAAEYTEAARMMRTLHRLHHAWGDVRPAPPLRRSDVMLLGCLTDQDSRGGPPFTIGELARRLHQSPPAITQKVNGLEEQGFLKRTVDESDRRVACVELTDQGREMAEHAMRAFWGRLEQALSSMGRRDAEEMLRLMERLCQALEDSADGPEHKH